MRDVRTIKRTVAGMPTVDGAGVKLVRFIGRGDTKDFDPFLMLDAFNSVNPDDYIKGFPWHPHRGIETITYLIHGDIEHGDSLGNKGRILDGECQWMTAGSGIIHQEIPKPSERMLGVQLWLNLPAKEKMTRPKYHGIAKTDIPVIDAGGRKIHVLSGSYGGVSGAMEGEHVKPLFLDVEAGPGVEWSLQTKGEDTLFVYIMQGEGVFGPAAGEFVKAMHVLLFDAGEEFRVRASGNGVRFLLLSAKPLGEPIAWGGPIVMNTREELEMAFKELDENRFIKH
jgi:redox-sensitive bicupin YhaK (pirin superfamily)